MPNNAPSERPIRFFDLPKELRDTIYDKLKIDHTICSKEYSEGYDLAKSVHMLMPHVRLVCRQLKLEAEAQAWKTTTPMLEEFSMAFYAGPFITVPDLIFAITTDVELRLVAWDDPAQGYDADEDDCTHDCPAAECIAVHRTWIETFRNRLRNLKFFQIELVIKCAYDDEQSWPKAAHGPELLEELNDFVEMEGITAFEGYKGLSDLGIAENLWVTWTPDEGWYALKSEERNEDVT